jgi:hypothetical protein
VRWHTDPAHEWLEVDYADLVALGIEDAISSFSYRNGDTVYLEEDCDAPLFLEAGDIHSWECQCDSVDYDDFAPLRQYAPYAPGRVNPGKA